MSSREARAFFRSYTRTWYLYTRQSSTEYQVESVTRRWRVSTGSSISSRMSEYSNISIGRLRSSRWRRLQHFFACTAWPLDDCNQRQHQQHRQCRPKPCVSRVESQLQQNSTTAAVRIIRRSVYDLADGMVYSSNYILDSSRQAENS